MIDTLEDPHIYHLKIPNIESSEEITEQSDEPSEETIVEDFSVIQNPLNDPMSTAIQTES